MSEFLHTPLEPAAPFGRSALRSSDLRVIQLAKRLAYPRKFASLTAIDKAFNQRLQTFPLAANLCGFLVVHCFIAHRNRNTFDHPCESLSDFCTRLMQRLLHALTRRVGHQESAELSA